MAGCSLERPGLEDHQLEHDCRHLEVSDGGTLHCAKLFSWTLSII
jgi:hypothetical protein